MHTEETKRFLEVLAEIKDFCLQQINCENCPLKTSKVCDGDHCPSDWKVE